MSEGYNGYKNYPTWVVCLWIDNSEWTYGYWREKAREALSEADGDSEKARSALAATLKSKYEDEWETLTEGVPTNVYDDLMSYSLGQVDWHEVAESRLDDDEWKGER